MLVQILHALVLGLSVCADCFAVSICSSTSLRDESFRKISLTALAFAFVQAGLLTIGWLFGDLFVGYIERIAGVIGFLLLLYVGGSMIMGALRHEGECRDLNGFRNVVLGAIATSIDAFSIGISLSMGLTPQDSMVMNIISVFAITFLSVALGMAWGQKIGKKVGKWAQITGGIVLVLIGVGILF